MYKTNLTENNIQFKFTCSIRNSGHLKYIYLHYKNNHNFKNWTLRANIIQFGTNQEF
jgi:hypothetical protein